MPYTMRKTPRSSFMFGDDGVDFLGVQIYPPSPPATPPTTASGPNYLVWGGVAILAYLILKKR
jgi:hypothetical protein